MEFLQHFQLISTLESVGFNNFNLEDTMGKKIILVGVSGASGVETVTRFCDRIIEIGHVPKLIVSEGAKLVGNYESSTFSSTLLTRYKVFENSLGGPPASGSFQSLGMIVYPCSIGTLSKIVNSTNDSLLVRAADVTLKEGRPLILVVRETPLHKGHLRLMLDFVDRGGVIMPFMPAFYIHDRYNMKVNLDNFNGRLLSRFGIQNEFFTEWDGLN